MKAEWVSQRTSRGGQDKFQSVLSGGGNGKVSTLEAMGRDRAGVPRLVVRREEGSQEDRGEL